jgi:hypothetical protein
MTTRMRLVATLRLVLVLRCDYGVKVRSVPNTMHLVKITNCIA